jgi:PAS domain S-box-containing protein
MLIAAIILALYFWAYFADVNSIGAALLVNDTTAIMAGVAFIAGFISYLWAPKKYVFWGSYAAFVILCAMAATLILNTGDTASPFIALWMIVCVFAGIFGFYGLLPLLIATTAYLVMQLIGDMLGRETLITILLAGELPLVASYVIWHTKAKADPSDDRAYRELATELSQVAGKSEVVINAIADGVIAINSKGIIQLINPAAQQIIGWGKQDALSLDYKSVLKLVDKNDNELQPSTDPITQALATNKETTTNNLGLLTNSGKKLLISIIVSPVGQVGSGAIIVFRDITKEKAEEREQAEFISTASHEMRTPVASIEGYLGLALNPATAQIDDKARDFITKAHESAQHLGRLFQDLLDVTKADDGRLANNPKAVDVVAFAHDIVQGLKPKADEKGLRILFKPLPDDDNSNNERRLSPVYYANVDNDHLREVIANLVENGIKYTPKGDVVIDVTGDTEHVTISVADSGIGIPKEDMSHLFQKFYRVDNSATREIGGTGLGLYLCRRLTETMNGRIWVESEYKQGSTFYVELPRIDHEEATRLIEAASIEKEQEAALAAIPVRQIPSAPVLEEAPVMSPLAAPVDEAAFTNAPVQAVVQQMQSINTSIPRAPIVAAPVPRANVPLSNIEQDPGQYIRTRRDGVPIPQRNQK